LLKNLIKLLISLSLINNVYADTTNNLVSQDFTTGWSGSNISTTHGSNVIAGVDGQYVVSDSVSLNDAGINKESLNEGFSVTGSADIWFWNNETQSVTQTIKTVDDNGQTITQNRTVSGTCATWNGCGYGSMTDTLIVNSNTQQDYDVSLRYSFSVPNQPSGHYGADLKNPSLTVDYTYVPPLDSATQTALLELNTEIGYDLEQVDNFTFKDEEITFDDFSMDTMLVESKEETPELEPEAELSNDQDLIFTENDQSTSDASVGQTDSQESQILDQGEKTEDDNIESSSEQNTSQGVADKDDKSLGEKKDSVNVSLNKTMAKIDDKIKDIDKNLQMKNFVKIKAMMSQNILLNYNVPFYKDNRIYENQPNITDTRILYGNASLVSYTQNDPILQKETQIQKIRQQKEKLLREIEVLKNG
jgi:hypothetical protein